MNESTSALPFRYSGQNNAALRALMDHGYAFILASITIAIGLGMLHKAKLVTSGVAGMALLSSYGVKLSPTTLFGIINIPFFALAWAMLGATFALRSALVTGAIVLAGLWVSHSVTFSSVAPAAAAAIGGSLVGLGVLFAARHSTGVGGTAILAICLNRKLGWNMGKQGICIDAMIVIASIPILGWRTALYSLISAASVNLVLYVWHRPAKKPE